MPRSVCPTGSVASATSHWRFTYQRPRASCVKLPVLTVPSTGRDSHNRKRCPQYVMVSPWSVIYAALKGIHPSDRLRERHLSLIFLNCLRRVTYSVQTC